MRITNNMLINNMLNNIGNNLTRMDRFQNQLATGKKIQVPSDDPVVAARALKLRTDVSEVEQYQRNIKDAQSWLDITESTIGNVGDVLHRVRELAVQASNGTNAKDDTQKISKEVEQLREQIIHLANTTYAGRNIFSGYKTDTKLIDETTGEFIIDVKNTEAIKYEIGIGDDININVPGGELFNGGNTAVAESKGAITGNDLSFPITVPAAPNNTVDLVADGVMPATTITLAGSYADMGAMISDIQGKINASALNGMVTVSSEGKGLKFSSTSIGSTSSISLINSSTANSSLGFTITAPATSIDGTGTDAEIGSLIKDLDSFIVDLNSGNKAGIGQVIAKMDSQISNLLRVRADVGARQNRLELTANRLDSDNINFTKLMSDNEDVDMAETIMNLKNEENVYRASLSGGARIIQPTLVDFLR